VLRRAAKDQYEYSCEDLHAVSIHVGNAGRSGTLGLIYLRGCRGRKRPYPVLYEFHWNRKFTYFPLPRPMYVGVDKDVPSSAVAKWNPSGMSNLGISEDEWEFQGWAVFFS
jgi:hypothetical protein